MAKHIMVDLETWGKTPGSDIRSIGAVVFDPVTGTLGDEFYVNVENPHVSGVDVKKNGYFFDDTSGAWRRYPLVRDPDTVIWWGKQSAEAQRCLEVDKLDLYQGLESFWFWWQQQCDDPGDYARLWAQGPHFDEQILAACYRAVGRTQPWHYRAPRDVRTILEAAGLDPKTGIPNFGVAHNALDDAKAQALGVIEAYRLLRKPVEYGAWPAYDTDIVDALDAYSKECSEAIGRFSITERMSATFRWHEAWERVGRVIAKRARAVVAAGDRRFTVDKAAHDRRVSELIAANNAQVEKRRAATALLGDAATLFREYEASHRAKVTANAPETAPDEIARNADATRKAERNAAFAQRIEAFLSEIHA